MREAIFNSLSGLSSEDTKIIDDAFTINSWRANVGGETWYNALRLNFRTIETGSKHPRLATDETDDLGHHIYLSLRRHRACVAGQENRGVWKVETFKRAIDTRGKSVCKCKMRY